MFGGAFGYAVSSLFPALEPHAGNFAIVGMMAFFAAAAKAPVSTIIMISEMTGGYGLLAPAMFAVVTAFILSGKKTIFPAQVDSRLDSPFHADEFEPIALRRVKVADVMIHLPVCVNAQASVAEAMSLMGDYGLASLPVGGAQPAVRPGHVAGDPSRPRRAAAEHDRQGGHVVGMASRLSRTRTCSRSSSALRPTTSATCPVVTREQPDRPIGLITRSGLWSALEAAKQRGG